MHLTLLTFLTFTTSAILTSAILTSAQVIFNTSTYEFTCPSTPLNGAYCTGPSLSSNIIVRCTGTAGVAGNCNDNLDGVPPIGVKIFAPCYESSLTAGDAACSYNGIVYPDHGASFPIPGSSNSSASNSSMSTAPATATAAGSNNVSLSLTPATSLSTSTDIVFVSSSSAPAIAGYTALAALGTFASARYPIPAATNGTIIAAAATGTGTGAGVAPSKTGGSGVPFTGAAGRTEVHVGAVFANLVAEAAAFGLMLLL